MRGSNKTDGHTNKDNFFAFIKVEGGFQGLSKA